MFLAASIFFAIKEAIKSARIDAGVAPEFTLDVPATCARIRMACEDDITRQVGNNKALFTIVVKQVLNSLLLL